ncbi:hypothetical protein RclHR1_02480011 [Rhizophagus clarus]|uniref:Kinase-like domain-containing protein n=1 Tax=Rhizophagus clarus TaxID=94130 RepID=A0A2Z6R2S5_9GLOM|nr:hypothetical protein RclHR1_02480011 [Rhizophagus clarus]GET02849.1 kinase-like domain-containing protein [Rhizophagus clarus]
MERFLEIKEQLAKEFDTWTSGDVKIDEIVQKSQIEARDYSDILEWIEFSKLKDFEYTGFEEFYEACWIDGYLFSSSLTDKRFRDTKVGLQYINNEKIPEVLIQIKKYLMIIDKSNFRRLFGFSFNPDKNKYALVIDYIKHDVLYQYLKISTLGWSEKYQIIRKIVTLLKNLHENHISLNYFSSKSISVRNSDEHYVKFSIFVGCGLENDITYIAPEKLQETERENDPSSDIYALGMIFYTIIFDQEPFADIEDESQLKNKIINGTRPQFLQDIPHFLKELIIKCLDADPSNRPTINEVENILLQNSIYEFQYYDFSLNDDKEEFQNTSCISERFYENSLDVSASFRLYSEQLLKSIKSTNDNNVTSDFGGSFASSGSISGTYINFYPLKGDKHRFKFKTENHDNRIDIINKDQISDKQIFGDSCINNISSARIGDVNIIIKKLKDDIRNDEDKFSLLQEQLNYWNKICKYHDNIVEFLGILMDENKISLILPHAHEGNLRDYLKSKTCSLEEKIGIATNIADGVLYIHKDLDIIHETLHPKNILMFNGIAKISDLPLPYNKKKFSYFDKYLFDNIGYIDPNLLLNEKFKKDKSMDIYSLGTLLWEIMSEVIPYSKNKNEGILQLVLKIKNNDYREEDIRSISYEYTNIYKECWKGNNLSRPKIENIYERLLNQENNINNSKLQSNNLGLQLNNLGSQLNNSGSQSNNSGSQSNNSDSQSNNSGLQSNNSGSQSNNSGLQSNNSGLQSNNSGSQSNNSGSQSNNSGSQSNNLGSQSNNSGSQSNNLGSQSNNSGLQSNNLGLQSNNSGLQSNNSGLQLNNSGSQLNNLGSQLNNFGTSSNYPSNYISQSINSRRLQRLSNSRLVRQRNNNNNNSNNNSFNNNININDFLNGTRFY